MPIRFIVPIDILREPDDVTLVRFSLAQKHGEAVRPIVPHRRQSDGAGAPVRHLPAEIASDLPRASAIDHGGIYNGAENTHKAGCAEDPAPPGVSAYRAFPRKIKIEREKSGDNKRYQEKFRDLSRLNEIPVDIPPPPWYKYPCSDCNPELLICKAKQRISIYGGNTMSTFMANKANI